jgi:drug/metabolite transporter (DMT)-like permease
MIFKKDSLKLGLALGLIGPVLGLVIIYFSRYSAFSFREFLDEFLNTNRLITSIGSLALLANAAIFAIYVHFNKSNTFKGVFIVTLIYGIGILVLKILN